jgi:hypothetical protein
MWSVARRELWRARNNTNMPGVGVRDRICGFHRAPGRCEALSWSVSSTTNLRCDRFARCSSSGMPKRISPRMKGSAANSRRCVGGTQRPWNRAPAWSARRGRLRRPISHSVLVDSDSLETKNPSQGTQVASLRRPRSRRRTPLLLAKLGSQPMETFTASAAFGRSPGRSTENSAHPMTNGSRSIRR